MSKIVNNLINFIERNESKNNDTRNENYHRHYSGIYKNGKQFYVGTNHLRNSYNNECIWYSTHAEMDVLYKVLKKDKVHPFRDIVDLSNYTIVVLRYGKDGHLRNSRPCNHCLDTMVKYRIKKIVYSKDDGSIAIEKPEIMEHIHISSGWSAFCNPERLK
jgi:deoxycytidylate deaminase